MGLTTPPCATSAGPAVSENTARAKRTGIPISIVLLHTAVAGRARLKVGGLRVRLHWQTYWTEGSPGSAAFMMSRQMP